MKAVLFILISLSALAAHSEIYGFNPISINEKTVGSPLEVLNVPPIMSQDTLGICYAYASSTMLTTENCRKLNEDCTHISEKKIFSPLYLSSLGRSQNGSANNSNPDAKNNIGGVAPNVLQKIAYEDGQGASEDCMSLDKVLEKVGGAKEASQMQESLWARIKSSYEKYQDLSKTCPTCAANFFSTAKDDINQNLNITKSNEEILRAFSEDTYGKFLDQLLFPKECIRLSKNVQFENTQKVVVTTYPPIDPQNKSKLNRGNYETAIAHIKKALTDGRLISLDGLCLDKKLSTPEKCENRHTVVISGYRKICDQNNKCHDAIKIINSWGQAWQDANAQGWVDAKTLIDRTQYQEASLTWFVDRK